MTTSKISTKGRRAANDSWDYVELTLRENRVVLIKMYNEIAGPPSLPMSVVQDEFIKDLMSEHETIAFVKVCRGLIAAAQVGAWPSV